MVDYDVRHFHNCVAIVIKNVIRKVVIGLCHNHNNLYCICISIGIVNVGGRHNIQKADMIMFFILLFLNNFLSLDVCKIFKMFLMAFEFVLFTFDVIFSHKMLFISH